MPKGVEKLEGEGEKKSGNSSFCVETSRKKGGVSFCLHFICLFAEPLKFHQFSPGQKKGLQPARACFISGKLDYKRSERGRAGFLSDGAGYITEGEGRRKSPPDPDIF